MKKLLRKLEIERNFRNLIKIIYKILTENIILNDKRLFFIPIFRNKAKTFVCISVIQHGAGNSSHCNKLRKGNRVIQIRKEEIKLCFCESKNLNIIPFAVTEKHETLDVNLTEHVQEFYAENDKMLMKEIKQNLNKFLGWKAPHSKDVNSLQIDIQV